MPRIELNDLNEDVSITEEELKHVKGGLLPAYQLSSYKLTSYKLTSPSLEGQIIEGVYKF